MSSVIAMTLLNIPLFRQTGNPGDLVKLLPMTLFIVYLFALIKFKKIHPIAIIGISALVGIIFGL